MSEYIMKNFCALPHAHFYHLNEQDAAAGSCDVNGWQQACIQTPYGNTAIAFDGVARSINNSGVAVGDADVLQPFIYENGSLIDLRSILKSGWGSAADINDKGQVVGWAAFEADADLSGLQAFLYDPKAPVPVQGLGVLEGFDYSIGTAINNSGQVVGYVTNDKSSPSRQAFLYSEGKLQLIDQSFDNYLDVLDINDSGTVLLTVQDASVGSQGYLWNQSSGMAKLPVGFQPFSLNNFGYVSGQLSGPGNETSGAVYHPSLGVRDLNLWTSKEYAGGDPRKYFTDYWKIVSAPAINDHGHIVVVAQSSQGVVSNLLVPEPMNRRNGAELVSEILFGIRQDAGGVQFVGNHPLRVDPWGPVQQPESRRNQQLSVGLKVAELSKEVTNERLRRTLEKISEEIIESAVASRK